MIKEKEKINHKIVMSYEDDGVCALVEYFAYDKYQMRWKLIKLWKPPIPENGTDVRSTGFSVSVGQGVNKWLCKLS
ncbi:unnamed protein product [marine sediment metagenome]|uniref:Uncharacterized protein n=1 Tax=marine sediment metagenome TaxID=412755 RepID=X0V1J7_9ZZZZ